MPTFALLHGNSSSLATANPQTLAFATNPTPGNLLVVGLLSQASTTIVGDPSDTYGTVWHQAAAGVSGTVGLTSWIYYGTCGAGSGTDTFSITFDTTHPVYYIALTEFTWSGTALAQDGTGQYQDGTAAVTNIILPQITTTLSVSLLINLIGGNLGTFVSPWVAAATISSGNGMAYYPDATPTTYAPNATQGSSVYTSTVAAIGLATPTSQTLRPDADLDTTGWTLSAGTNAYALLSDSSDTTLITSTI
jgi:hypothetical protein